MLYATLAGVSPIGSAAGEAEPSVRAPATRRVALAGFLSTVASPLAVDRATPGFGRPFGSRSVAGSVS